jgi:hypothetical protein
LRATEPINTIAWPQLGHFGGGVGAGGTVSGARQSSNAWMRSRFARAAAPNQP